jgi:predicted transcriptional regulator
MMVVADTLLYFSNGLIERRCIQSLQYGRKGTGESAYVEDVMSKNIIKMNTDSPVLEVAKTLAKRNVSSVLLEDSGKIIGILT